MNQKYVQPNEYFKDRMGDVWLNKRQADRQTKPSAFLQKVPDKFVKTVYGSWLEVRDDI